MPNSIRPHWVIITLCTLILSSCGSEAVFHGSEGLAGLRPGSEPASADVVVETQDEAEPGVVILPPVVDPASPPEVIDEETPAPVDTSIVFGNRTVFHIGDDDYGGSSCQVDISDLEYSGKKYNFYFTVVDDATSVDIQIKKICGVDLLTSNVVTLFQGGQQIYTVLLTKDQVSLQIPSHILQSGEARLVVESLLNKTEVNIPGGNHDDFVIGDILITADKSILPGAVVIE